MEKELEQLLQAWEKNEDNPVNHPDDCDCDVCGSEMHPAHVTLNFSGLLPKVQPKGRGRGFASMTPEQRRAAGSRGGKAATHRHTWTSEEAQAAGKRGQERRRENACLSI
jgi:uncharacterized protein